jgi:hypothetical protein
LEVLTSASEPSLRCTSQPQPEPKVLIAVLVNFFLERRERAERGVDGVGQLAGGFAAAVGLQAVPVEGVVPDLRGVVEHAALRLADDLLQSACLELGALDQVVEVVT